MQITSGTNLIKYIVTEEKWMQFSVYSIFENSPALYMEGNW